MFGKFFFRITVVAILVTGITFLVQQLAIVNFIDAFAYSSIIFFYILTVLVIAVSGAMRRNNNRQFTTAVTAALGIKIFASIIFVLGYSFISKPSSIIVVFPFFIYYVIFTVVEVTEMLKLNKQAVTKEGVSQ